jgi:hypothetical protein
MDWKVRSKIYHMMTPDPGDDLSKETIIFEDMTKKYVHNDIVREGLFYAYKNRKELYYPSKSYVVATIYAILLAKYFYHGNRKKTFELMKDPDLLAGNDPYFAPLNEENKDIYQAFHNSFFESLNQNKLDEFSDNFKRTIDYFYKEFLLAEDTKIYLPPH